MEPLLGEQVKAIRQMSTDCISDLQAIKENNKIEPILF